MKLKIFILICISAIFVSCASTPAANEKKVYQSQEEKD